MGQNGFFCADWRSSFSIRAVRSFSSTVKRMPPCMGVVSQVPTRIDIDSRNRHWYFKCSVHYQMPNHKNVAGDSFLASPGDLLDILALVGKPRRGGREARAVECATEALASRAIPADSTPAKRRRPVVVRASEPGCPAHPKRERLRAEVLALLQSTPVMRTAPPSIAH